MLLCVKDNFTWVFHKVKNGIKKADKVHQRIGRAIEKYPSAAKFCNIELVVDNELTTHIHYTKKTSKLDDQELGCYFIKTNLNPSCRNNYLNI